MNTMFDAAIKMNETANFNVFMITPADVQLNKVITHSCDSSGNIPSQCGRVGWGNTVQRDWDLKVKTQDTLFLRLGYITDTNTL